MPADLTFDLPLHGPQSVSRVRLIFALALVVVFLGGIIASSVQLQRQIGAQSTTQSDSVLWSLAQLDAPELRWHEKVSAWLPGNWWLWVAGAGLWLAAGALVLPRVLRWQKSGGLQMLVAFGVVVFIFALVANVGVVSRTDIGFILKKNTPLRLTPTGGSELISTLPAGEPVRRVKERGNYFFIRTSMAAGWVERGQVGLVNE